MFDFDPNTIYVIKILAVYFFGAISAAAAIVFAIIYYDVRTGNVGLAEMPHEQELGADLEHIDIALNDNLYVLP
jgi:hypothetical protein